MDVEDKYIFQNLRRQILKKPVINLRLEAPYPEGRRFGNFKKLTSDAPCPRTLEKKKNDVVSKTPTAKWEGGLWCSKNLQKKCNL